MECAKGFRCDQQRRLRYDPNKMLCYKTTRDIEQSKIFGKVCRVKEESSPAWRRFLRISSLSLTFFPRKSSFNLLCIIPSSLSCLWRVCALYRTLSGVSPALQQQLHEDSKKICRTSAKFLLLVVVSTNNNAQTRIFWLAHFYSDFFLIASPSFPTHFDKFHAMLILKNTIEKC